MQAHNAYVDGAGANPALAAETVVQTLAAGVTAPAGVLVVLEGVVQVNTGAGTTAVVVRVRRGNSAAGALVGGAVTTSVTAGNSVVVPFQVADTPGEVQGQPYVVTVQQTGGTANGATPWTSIQASWIS